VILDHQAPLVQWDQQSRVLRVLQAPQVQLAQLELMDNQGSQVS
jgi:hypothetical protein